MPQFALNPDTTNRQRMHKCGRSFFLNPCEFHFIPPPPPLFRPPWPFHVIGSKICALKQLLLISPGRATFLDWQAWQLGLPLPASLSLRHTELVHAKIKFF